MAVRIALPKLGMTMEDATLLRWIKLPGDWVQQGEPVAEVETEKVTFEVEAPADGVLQAAASVDDVLNVGDTLGYMLARGEAPAASGEIAPDPSIPTVPAAHAVAEADVRPDDTSRELRASPAARSLARTYGINLGVVTGTGPSGRIKEADVQAFHAREAVPRGIAHTIEPPRLTSRTDVAPISPLARRAATRLGVDVASITGSGHLGRVRVPDVEVAAQGQQASAETQSGERVRLRGMRRTIGQRMHRSLQETAQLTITMKAVMTESVRLRDLLIGEWESEGLRLTYTDIVIRAVAMALHRHPIVNARIDGDDIVHPSEINIGLSVAVDDGLIVPVVRRADTLYLHDIAKQTKSLATAARTRSLTAEQVEGGTFTVTTLGAYGVESFTPIVNYPESAILGIGVLDTEAAFDGERVFPRSVMRLSLSFDHRLIDGAPAADFLRDVVRLIEKPHLMI